MRWGRCRKGCCATGFTGGPTVDSGASFEQYRYSVNRTTNASKGERAWPCLLAVTLQQQKPGTQRASSTRHRPGKASVRRWSSALARMAPFPGTLGQDAAQLAAWLELQDELGRRIEKLYFYAAMSQAVDTADQAAAAMVGQAASLYSNFLAAGSFAGPEILALGEEDCAAHGRGSAGAAAPCPLVQRPLPPGRARAFGRGGGSAGAGQRTLRGGRQHRPGAGQRRPAFRAGDEQPGRGRGSGAGHTGHHPGRKRPQRRGAQPGKATPTATCP